MKNSGRGLLAWVYRDARSNKGCTNGGLSDCFPEFVVFGTDEVPLEGYIDRGEYALPECELRRGPYGTVHVWMPPSPSQDPACGPMFGGNFLATSDGRFSGAVGFYGAVPIHDRYESQQQYDLLSE